MKSVFKSPAFAVLLLAFILLSHGLALWFNLYYLFWWLDNALHFLGGFEIVLVFNLLIKYFGLNLMGARVQLASLTIFLGLTALSGILWEFFEFFLNRYIVHIGFINYEDTLTDLFFDLLGGVVGFILVL